MAVAKGERGRLNRDQLERVILAVGRIGHGEGAADFDIAATEDEERFGPDFDHTGGKNLGGDAFEQFAIAQEWRGGARRPTRAAGTGQAAGDHSLGRSGRRRAQFLGIRLVETRRVKRLGEIGGQPDGLRRAGQPLGQLDDRAAFLRRNKIGHGFARRSGGGG